MKFVHAVPQRGLAKPGSYAVPCHAVPHYVQASLWNFVQYNVVGGGDSALYGVEGPTYYLRNGFNNFQLVLPLALALPLVAVVAGCGSLSSPAARSSRGSSKQQAAYGSRASVLRLLACVSPLYVWLGAITALPHKEERFLYVAYPLVSGYFSGTNHHAWVAIARVHKQQPQGAELTDPLPASLIHIRTRPFVQICLAAAASFVGLCAAGRRLLGLLLPQRLAAATINAGAALFLGGTCLLALSRSTALVVNYGAPMRIYTHLPEVRALLPRPCVMYVLLFWAPCSMSWWACCTGCSASHSCGASTPPNHK